MKTVSAIRSSLLTGPLALSIFLQACAPTTGPAPVSPSPAVPPAALPATPSPAAAASSATAVPVPTPRPVSPQPTAAVPTAQALAETPRRGGIMLNHAQPLSILDPHQIPSTLVGRPFITPVFNSLLTRDPDTNYLKIVGDLAERWELSRDGSTYTFTLRSGMKWHDGKPITAEDARFSLDRILNPPKGMPSPWKDMISLITNIEVIDPTTLRIQIKHPSASFASRLTLFNLSILPQHFYSNFSPTSAVVVGSGPFKVKSYSPGVRMELVRNPDFFRQGRPYLDGVNNFEISDIRTAYGALRAGRLHLTSIILSAAEAEELSKTPNFKVARYGGAFLMVTLNPKRKPFDDVRVRRAVHLAMDRQAGLNATVLGWGSVGAHLMPGSEWAIPNEELTKMPGFRQPKNQDIAEAQKLMAEAGYTSGVDTTFIIRGGQRIFETQGLYVRDQLGKIGIRSTVVVKSGNSYFDALAQADYDALAARWAPEDTDPEFTLVRHFSSGGERNFTRFQDAKLQELLDKQAVTSDSSERLRLVRAAQDRVIELGLDPMAYWFDLIAGYSTKLRNFKPGPTPNFPGKFYEIWLGE
ncbi:MAG: ABC transporter substrate-binding protein [Chloroflexi bacterium]|nr:ABC transporter substrate-binding protein [Chloroflexota bacterium]